MKKRKQKDLTIEPLGNGTYRITTTLYNKDVSAIVWRSFDMDILDDEYSSAWRKAGAKKRLIEKCILKYKSLKS